METMFCLAAIPVKWAICFTLLRIANGKKVYEWAICPKEVFSLYVTASLLLY
jgi:hypothetical protein